jgi:chitin synthase
MVCFWRIWTSGHGFIRKIMLNIITIYSQSILLLDSPPNRELMILDLINLIFNWLSVSSFYLAFYFLIDSSISTGSDPFGGAGADIFAVFNKVYIGLM